MEVRVFLAAPTRRLELKEEVEGGGVTRPGGVVLLDNRRLPQGGLANAVVQLPASRTSVLGLANSASFLLDAATNAIAQARENNIASPWIPAWSNAAG